jgi:hypothetical protein
VEGRSAVELEAVRPLLSLLIFSPFTPEMPMLTITCTRSSAPVQPPPAPVTVTPASSAVIPPSTPPAPRATSSSATHRARRAILDLEIHASSAISLPAERARFHMFNVASYGKKSGLYLRIHVCTPSLRVSNLLVVLFDVAVNHP